MISIKEAVIVEGIYDKMKLEQFISGLIIPTHGFSLFKDMQRKEMIKLLAEKQGIVILTDSDRAGFLIRRHIQSFIPKEQIKHAYIPEILGKEKRKRAPGKEGLKGVEGVSQDIILFALKTAGCRIESTEEAESVIEYNNLNTVSSKEQNTIIVKSKIITKQDLYRDGLSGKQDSSRLRTVLLRELNLPARLNTNNLIEVLNALFTYEQYQEYINNFLMRHALEVRK
jgi:ribonuclease M5